MDHDCVLFVSTINHLATHYLLFLLSCLDSPNYVHLYVCVCVCVCVRMHVHVYCVHVCMCVCARACVRVYVRAVQCSAVHNAGITWKRFDIIIH